MEAQGSYSRKEESKGLHNVFILFSCFTTDYTLSQKPKAGSKKAVSSATSLETNERLQAARDKRQTQRNRLKEMKLAAKRAREQEAESAVEQEPGEEDTQSQEEPSPSPKKSKLGE